MEEYLKSLGPASIFGDVCLLLDLYLILYMYGNIADDCSRRLFVIELLICEREYVIQSSYCSVLAKDPFGHEVVRPPYDKF